MKKLIIIIPLVVFVCCNKNKKNEPEPADPFDKQALLVNMADNVILPAYNNFKISFDSLTAAYEVFKTSGLASDFQITKQKFNSAYLKYQRISPQEFGPAETQVVRMNFNVFPTDTTQIKNNISAGTYNLAAASNLDAKGMPALDFLFYGKNTSEAQIVQSFTSTPNRKQYVSDLLSDMSVKINAVLNTWNSSYRNTFVNSLSTDVGSSLGFLVNQLNYELDYLKNFKIGTPLGKKTLGIPVPDNCESYYAGRSVEYALETLYTLENIYLGRNLASYNGLGFDDYLDHLHAEYNGSPLNQTIINQFAVAKIKLKAVPDPLSAQVTSNAAVVDAAYTELVKLLVLLKTDMPSQLGVVITYQDGDGD